MFLFLHLPLKVFSCFRLSLIAGRDVKKSSRLLGTILTTGTPPQIGAFKLSWSWEINEAGEKGASMTKIYPRLQLEHWIIKVEAGLSWWKIAETRLDKSCSLPWLTLTGSPYIMKMICYM